ncbi:MAG: CPBP family intramembrane metalloprotease [Erysipelotrichaceae bacterium]|nr:CPBP family intramembrane metalloprotease [Erysipelotrichaceae bacterium]
MMTFSRKNITALFLSVLAVIVMSCIEKYLAPAYFVKSLLKVLVFAGSVFLHALIHKENVFELIRLRKKKIPKKLLFLMIGVYVFVLAAFFLFRDQIDLAHIRESLLAKEGLTRQNFVFIFGYIILCNSFLEEAFFRGFVSTNVCGRKIPAVLISAFLFSVYHIGIMSSWFSPLIFVICVIGLMIAGLFLQWLSDLEDTILLSWFVHGFANLAINTIAVFMLFM